MSGHSKWSTIKRQKGANDAKRGALFTKLVPRDHHCRPPGRRRRRCELSPAHGGREGEARTRCRPTTSSAPSSARPAAGADAEQFEEITYEGIGPANVAVIVAAMTDNRNRTASEIRSVFNKVGGTLSTVAWQFEQKGVISLPLNGRDPDEMTLAAIDAGAADVGAPDGGQHHRHHRALRPRGGAQRSERRGLRGGVGRALDGADDDRRDQRREDGEGGAQFMERLEDLDDVQNVYANFDIPAELMEQLEAQVV